MIYIVGIGITFFLSFILLTKNNKTYADKILFAWLCVITVHLTLFAIISSQEYFEFPYLLGLEIAIPFLHGPLLFLYTCSLTAQRVTTRNSIVHFIPFVMGLVSIFPFLIKSTEEKKFVYRNEGIGYTTLTSIIFLGIVFSGITYSILSLRALLKHKKKIKENYSYTEKKTLQWLFNLIIGLSCIWIIVFFADDEYIFASVVLYVFFVGYFGIKQGGIFSDQPPFESVVLSEIKDILSTTSADSESSKYEKSLLSNEQMENIHTELKLLMSKEKLFLIPELTLSMLSERLNVHPNTLSEVINRVEQKIFFDYINTLRVEEFKIRVARPENKNYTLLAIAHDCGFNSKTSFNRNFKNITGKSPSEYLKEIKISIG